MPAIVITAASVRAGADADFFQGYAGAAISAGMAVYQDRADAKLRPANALGGAGAANVKGIALHGAADGQPLRVQTAGNILIGGTTAIGEQYSLAATGVGTPPAGPGGIVPAVEVLSTHFVTQIGVGGSSNTIKLSLYTSGQQEP